MNMKPVQIGLFVVALVIAAYALLSGDMLEKEKAAERTPLSIGTNIWPGYEPLYLARELGYYDNKGIHLVEFASATQVVHAFRNRVILAAALTLDEVLLLKDYGLDPKLILVFDISEGADVIMAKKEITSMAALKGKRIGVENTALGAFVLMRALQLNGLNISDITIVSLPVNEHDSAFDAGKVDALITFEPVRSRLLSKGYHEIFTSKDMPGEVVDVLVVNKEALISHETQIDSLLQGWFDAVRYFEVRPDKAARVMAGRQKISVDEVLDSFNGLHIPDISDNMKMMGRPDALLLGTAERMAEVMLESKLLKNKLDLESMIVPDPLKRAENPKQ
ncbi:NitT/TauT family transport system substrate-binding protein [Mariprofundus aestuarium]|uniref:NitT/TauT family transport system substrate-binding protein n=1 Tax=Mariprofundus aestuarium TaxID=1921086 RepID=A0A2K8L5Q8_MARES|nr:ABC transporter substrate-binding protein [Mariprofundus aestuarium]ATX79566.1 NitT/TauT family transport system substrate-binding protein [Mariprofundus aestuarium]